MVPRSTVTVGLTVFLALCFNTLEGAFFTEPTSQIVFENQISTFSCHSNDTVFWQINGDLIDFAAQTMDLQERGFVFSDIFSEGSVIRKVSVKGSSENNNTVISCISVDGEIVNVSGNATLTVLGSPSNVTLTFDNIRLFTLAWERPSTPVGYEPHNYTVTIQYKPSASQTNTETVIIQASNETEYMYEYSVPSEQLPLSVCNQFVFMVVSTSGLGDSQPVSRSWEKLPSPGAIEDTQCFLQLNRDDSITALVQFTFPELCHFQKANYSFSLSPADTNSGLVEVSDTRTFVGGANRNIEGQLHNLKLDLSNIFQMRVRATTDNGEIIKMGVSRKCSFLAFGSGPFTQGLSNPSGDQSSLLLGIILSSVFLAITLSVYGIVAVVVCVRRNK